MLDKELADRVDGGGDRRWSEPVRLGEILVDLCAEIEARIAITVPQSRLQAMVRGLLRKAG
jgi:hypothetical protein